jgi:DNA polymerase-3 subunit delta
MASYDSQLDTSAQVTLLYGDSEILKQRATNVIIDARLTPEQREDGLSSLAAGEHDPNQLAATLCSRSLLAAERVIVLKRVDDLNADDQRVLAAALERLPDTTSVVMTCAETGKGKKPKVVKELAAAAKQAGQAVHIASPRKRALPPWITAEAKQCGKTITQQAVRLLQELTNEDVDMLVSEIEKVATYIGDRHEIEQADVEAVGFSNQQGNIWNMMDAIGNRQPTKALGELERMLPPGAVHGEALGLLGMVSRQLRLIWQTRVAARAGYRLDRTTDLPEELAASFPHEHNVADVVGSQQWLGKKMIAQARKFDDGQVARALDRVHQTDIALKGHADRTIDERTALEALIVELCKL